MRSVLSYSKRFFLYSLLLLSIACGSGGSSQDSSSDVVDDDTFSGAIALEETTLLALEQSNSLVLEDVPEKSGSLMVDLSRDSALSNRRMRSLEVASTTSNFNAFSGTIRNESAQDDSFFKLSYTTTTNSLEGLMRVNGVFYRLSSINHNGETLLIVEQVSSEEFEEAFSLCPHAEHHDHSHTHRTIKDTPVETPDQVRVLSLCTVAAPSFIELQGSLAQAHTAILSAIHSANGFYERDLKIRLEVTTLDSLPYDPTGQMDDPVALLETFTDRWQTSREHCDSVQLFMGEHSFTNGAIGISYVDEICEDQPYGVVLSTVGGRYLDIILAHELGHVLGAGHAESGIMMPRLEASMSGFSLETANEINQALAEKSCLSPDA